MKSSCTIVHATPSAKAGYTRSGVLLPLIACLVIGISIYSGWRAERDARHCAYQLRQLYQALELYELDHGTLPHLAFYPNHPEHDADSLFVVLDPYAVTSAIGLCPGAHPRIRQHGLSYVWNASLNGTHLQDLEPDTWLIMEISALSADLRAPHWGRHLVLYADGSIRRVRTAPLQL